MIRVERKGVHRQPSPLSPNVLTGLLEGHYSKWRKVRPTLLGNIREMDYLLDGFTRSIRKKGLLASVPFSPMGGANPASGMVYVPPGSDIREGFPYLHDTGGGILQLGVGSYKIPATINPRSHMKIWGVTTGSRWTTDFGTQLDSTLSGFIMTPAGVYDVDIGWIAFTDGGGVATNGVGYDSCRKVKTHDCYFGGFVNNAIFMRVLINNQYTAQNWLLDNQIDQVRSRGLTLQGNAAVGGGFGQVEDTLVQGNYIHALTTGVGNGIQFLTPNAGAGSGSALIDSFRICNNGIYRMAIGLNIVADDGTQAEYNSFEANTTDISVGGAYNNLTDISFNKKTTLGSPLIVSLSAGYIGRIIRNHGYNPVGKIALPFDNTNFTIGLVPANGVVAAALPTSLANDYTVINTDMEIADTTPNGGTITLKDPAANVISSGFNVATQTLGAPVGYKVRFVTALPTAIVVASS